MLFLKECYMKTISLFIDAKFHQNLVAKQLEHTHLLCKRTLSYGADTFELVILIYGQFWREMPWVKFAFPICLKSFQEEGIFHYARSCI